MGCDCSKPGRTDVPVMGHVHDFDVRPVGDKIVVYDGSGSKWFEVDVDKHLRYLEEVTDEHYQEWKKAGKAFLRGPIGDEKAHEKEIQKDDYEAVKKDKKPLQTLEIGPAGFAALDHEDHPDILELWEAVWEGVEHEKLTWACTRELKVKSAEGKEEAMLRMMAVGQARARKTPEGGVVKDAKYHRVEYTLKIDGKDMDMVAVHEKARRYEGSFDIVPPGKSGQVSEYVDGCKIQTHMVHGKHCVIVTTQDQCQPLQGLATGIGMSSWLHPHTAEKHAKHFAYEIMREKLG